MSTSTPLPNKAWIQMEDVAHTNRNPIRKRLTWSYFIDTVTDKIYTMMDGLYCIRMKLMWPIYPGINPMNIMGLVWNPSTSVFLMAISWGKGKKYNSISRSQRIWQQKWTNKRWIGNSEMKSSGMARRNSGTVYSSNNGSNRRDSGSRLSVKHDG